MQLLRLMNVEVDKGITYLNSCSSSKFDPDDDWGFSSSSPDERATTLRFRMGGVRPAGLVRATCRGSCRAFVRRSSISSSLGVSSPPRSEPSSRWCPCGDRALLGLEAGRLGILSLGARQWTKNSPRTCNHELKLVSHSQVPPHTCIGHCNWLRFTAMTNKWGDPKETGEPRQWRWKVGSDETRNPTPLKLPPSSPQCCHRQVHKRNWSLQMS